VTHLTKPTVSVIIPAYNCGKYLDYSIKSVLEQTYGAVECIVVDDGSTDNTRQVAESHERVIYIHQANAERSAARNNGICHASGAYISFLDADDAIAPEKIADQVAFLERNVDCDAVYSKVMFFRDWTPADPFPLERITPSGDILDKLIYGNFITVHSPLFRKSAIEKVHGFNPALSRNEDWEFFLRLALSGVRFGFIDKCHAFCRIHGLNTSGDEIRMHQSKWQLAAEFVSEHAAELLRKGIDVQAVLSYHEADFGKSLIVHGEGGEGRRHIFRASRARFPKKTKYFLFAVASLLFGSRAIAWLGRGIYRERRG
jgi:glycosyltransferase involved in cell wall biosynthesis